MDLRRLAETSASDFRPMREDFTTPLRLDRFRSAQVLKRQLASPLFPALLQTRAMNSIELEAYLQTYRGPRHFGAQLLAPNPSLFLLTSIKLFAKQSTLEPESPLHGDPARVLYYAALAALETRHGKWDFRQSHEALHAGYRWAAEQAGAESLKLLFTRSLSGGSTPCYRPAS